MSLRGMNRGDRRPPLCASRPAGPRHDGFRRPDAPRRGSFKGPRSADANGNRRQFSDR
jgi:hypothetical protein